MTTQKAALAPRVSTAPIEKSIHIPHVLITGGAGFIGSHLAERLLEEGYIVSVLDDLSTGHMDNIDHLLSHPKFHFTHGSIMDDVLLEKCVSKCDTIFHLASTVGVGLVVGDSIRTIETIILGTDKVLKVAERYKRPVLLASTSEVYGKSECVPFQEDQDVTLGATSRNRWAYAASKMVDEFLALAYHRQKQLPVVIFRFFNTVGPRQTGQYGMVVPRFVQQAMNGKPITIYGDGEQTRCFCDVDDVVEGMLAIARSPGAIGSVFNIGSHEEISILDLAKKVMRIVAKERGSTNHQPIRPLVHLSYEEAYHGDGFEDIRHRRPDTQKIRELTGWQPKSSLDNVIKRIVQHFLRKKPTAMWSAKALSQPMNAAHAPCSADQNSALEANIV